MVEQHHRLTSSGGGQPFTASSKDTAVNGMLLLAEDNGSSPKEVETNSDDLHDLQVDAVNAAAALTSNTTPAAVVGGNPSALNSGDLQRQHSQDSSSAANTESKANTSQLSTGSSASGKSTGPPGSGLSNGVLQTDRQNKTCYGRELWDCLGVLEGSTKKKTKQMEIIKDLFSSIRKGLENFSAHITHST